MTTTEEKKKKEVPVQRDLLGTELKIGDVIAVARGNSLLVYKVSKLTPKMIRAKPIGPQRYYGSNEGELVYSNCAIKLDGPDAMAYVLKHS